jgi:hypothetical protein
MSRLLTLTQMKQRIDREVAEHELIHRLFYFWDTSCKGSLSFQVCFLMKEKKINADEYPRISYLV